MFMDSRAIKGCRRCSHGGRPREPENDYARELGIRPELLISLGGSAKLKALAPEVRNLLIKPAISYRRGSNAPKVSAGGMKALGMESRVPGIARNMPELLMTDEMFEGLSNG